MKYKIIFFLSTIFLYFIIPLYGSIDQKSISERKLGFKFSGNIDVINFLDPDHLRLRGCISFLNLKLEGDFDFEIFSKDPLSFRLSSKEIKLSAKELINLIQKLNINFPYFNDIHGPSIIKNINVLLKDNTYFCDIDSIEGPFFWNKNKLIVKKLKIKLNNLTKQTTINGQLISVGNSYVKNLSLNIDKNFLYFDSKSISCDIKAVSEKIFNLKPDIKEKIIEAINNYNLLRANNISLDGNLFVNNVHLKLVDIDKNATLTSLNGTISTEKILTYIYTERDKEPISVSLGLNSSNIVIAEQNLEFSFDKLHIVGEHIILNERIKELNIKSLSLPRVDFTLNVNGKLDFNKNSNKTAINVRTNIVFNEPFTIYTNNGSSLIFNIQPINLAFENNLLNMVNKGIYVVANNIGYFISRNQLIKLVRFNLSLSNLELKLDTIKNNFTVKTDFKITDTDLNSNDINFSIANFSSNTSINNEYLTLKNGIFNGIFNKNGEVRLSFSSIVPIKDFSKKVRYFFENLYLELDIKDVLYQNFKIKLINISKRTKQKINTTYFIKLPLYTIDGKTRIEKKNDYIDIITKKVSIIKLNQTKSNEKKDEIDENKIIAVKFPDIIKKISKKYHFELDEIALEILDSKYYIDNVKGDLLFDKKTFLGFSGYFCNLSFEAGSEFLNPGINSFVNIDSVSVPLDGLIGCFISQAPIYIKGDTNLTCSILTQGKTLKEIKDNLTYDLFVSISNGQVLKLSNLGKKIKMILEILSFVKLNPSKLSDSLEFNSITGSISGNIKKANIKQIIVSSPILNIVAQGSYLIDKKVLEVSGEIKKGWISKRFNLKEDFSKKKD